MTDHWQAWVDRYLDHLRTERGLSPHTVDARIVDLRDMAHWWAAETHQDVGALEVTYLTYPTCRAYLAHQTAKGLKPKTVKHRGVTLRSFLAFLGDEGALPEPLWRTKLVTPKVVERRANPLTLEELQALVAAVPRYTLVGERDRAWLLFALWTGLRISELLNLDLADLRLGAEPVCTVRKGKGSKDRVVPLHPHAVQVITHYLQAVRPALTHPHSPPAVWLSTQGHRMAATSARDRIRYYADLAGLSARHVHPHQLRASFATFLDAAGVNLTVIQELMGHANIQTTARYVGIAGREMRQAVQHLPSPVLLSH